MNPILEVRDIYKNSDGIKAVDGFSLSIEGGKIISLIGPNGAGKTTVFNIITGFIEPERGSIYYKGNPILGMPPYRIANLGIARTFQNLRVLDKLTVLENVLLARKEQRGEKIWNAIWRSKGQKKEENKNRERAMTLLKFVGLSGKGEDLAEELSYGQQKLLTIACNLSAEPDLLLLDEPVAGLHPTMISKMLSMIEDLSKKGKTIFLIEHNLEAVMEVSHSVIVMDEGRKIIEGDPQIIREDPEVIEAYLE